MSVTLHRIQDAARAIKGRIIRTPCLPAPRLSERTGADVWVKYDNLQFTRAFKERGALNRLLTLTPEERRRGVIAMSAGNHAQAVAWHASQLEIPATIVMPRTTPYVKVAATSRFGAEVVLEGDTLTEATARARSLAQQNDYIFIHPFDDEAVICGQGTIALEMLEDVPDLEVLVVPVGGGGLISGMAVAAKTINPDIRIIGVQSQLYPSMWNAIHHETRPTGGPSLAEGIAVERAGTLTAPLVARWVDEILLVEEQALEMAVNCYLMQQSTVAEGAGAAGLAAVLSHPETFRGRRTGLVVCGGNIDARILAAIMLRELERDERIVSFRLTIPDRPGVLGDIATTLGKAGANILEVDHKRHFLDVPAKGARLDVTVETRDTLHARDILHRLEQRGYEVVRLESGQ